MSQDEIDSYGILHVLPTPIGNLEDITYRAIKVLKEADVILAEDTRTSGFLLKHYDIATKMISHHKFNEHKSSQQIVERIEAGANIALISDAGTPAISDPGFLLVRACVEAGIRIECLPGATAFVPALVMSGLPNDRFCFEGFLPAKKGRQTRLKELQDEQRTMVFYESPYRVLKTLTQFADYFGQIEWQLHLVKYQDIRRYTTWHIVTIDKSFHTNSSTWRVCYCSEWKRIEEE